MLRRIAFLSAAAAMCAVLTVSASAVNGGVVGNVVDAGENVVNDVVRAGENVVDDVTDAVTGDSAADNAPDGGTADIPDEVPDATEEPVTEETGDIITDNGTADNPGTGVPFAYGAVAALALGGAGMALTFRRDD